MMSLTFGLFTQVSGSGPLGLLVFPCQRSRSQSEVKWQIVYLQLIINYIYQLDQASQKGKDNNCARFMFPYLRSRTQSVTQGQIVIPHYSEIIKMNLVKIPMPKGQHLLHVTFLVKHSKNQNIIKQCISVTGKICMV